MTDDVIPKTRRPGDPPPQLENYALARERFSWTAARASLEGFPDGTINIAHEAVDRHALGRSLAFILMIAGNTMVTMSQLPLFNILGLIFYLAGSITLLSVTRTYHVWV